MKELIKWTAVTAATVTGATFAYMLVMAARRRVDEGLRRAEQVTEDAKRVLANTQQTLDATQTTVRHLRSTVS